MVSNIIFTINMTISTAIIVSKMNIKNQTSELHLKLGITRLDVRFGHPHRKFVDISHGTAQATNCSF